MGVTMYYNPIGGATLSSTTAATTTKTTTSSVTLFSLHRSSSRNASHIVAAKGKFTSRTSKFDSKNRRGESTTTTTTTTTTKDDTRKDRFDNGGGGVIEDVGFADDGFVIPELPGDKPDFWEGPQMDAVGFFVQYMWAFGVGFALIACGVAVATYNEGATDFKETPAYKESVQSQGLLEEPEASGSDIFESNPTEVAPALE